MNDVAIGTHYFDLRCISNEQDGDRGMEKNKARKAGNKVHDTRITEELLVDL